MTDLSNTTHHPACTPDPIRLWHLLSLRGAVKLEKMGMKRRGKSAKAIAINEFELDAKATHDEIVARINKEIEYWNRLKEGELVREDLEG